MVSCSCLRASAWRARLSSPARTATIALRSHSFDLSVSGVVLLLQPLLVGDRDRDLLLRLDQLLLHLEQHLVQHLLRIFGLRDEVVEVRLDQRPESRKDSHGFHRAYGINGGRCNARASRATDRRSPTMSETRTRCRATSASSWTATAAGRSSAACRARGPPRGRRQRPRHHPRRAPARHRGAHAVRVLVAELGAPGRRGRRADAAAARLPDRASAPRSSTTASASTPSATSSGCRRSCASRSTRCAPTSAQQPRHDADAGAVVRRARVDRARGARGSRATSPPARCAADDIDVDARSTATCRPRGLPPLDLLIRTSGEQRISNFMLWEIAYAELVFTDVAVARLPPRRTSTLPRRRTRRRERRFGLTSAAARGSDVESRETPPSAASRLAAPPWRSAISLRGSSSRSSRCRILLCPPLRPAPEPTWALIFVASLLAMHEFFAMTLPSGADRRAALVIGAARVRRVLLARSATLDCGVSERADGARVRRPGDRRSCSR